MTSVHRASSPGSQELAGCSRSSALLTQGSKCALSWPPSGPHLPQEGA